MSRHRSAVQYCDSNRTHPVSQSVSQSSMVGVRDVTRPYNLMFRLSLLYCFIVSVGFGVNFTSCLCIARAMSGLTEAGRSSHLPS